jgi:hypothetical protein
VVFDRTRASDTGRHYLTTLARKKGQPHRDGHQRPARGFLRAAVRAGSVSGSAAAGIPASRRRRGYILTAGVLLVMMAGGTLPIPLYGLYQRQMGFGPLGVTVVFAAFVAGTLAALLTLGDLSDHVGRRPVLTIGVACAATSAALILAAHGIGLLITGRVVAVASRATRTAARGPPHYDRRDQA